MQFSGAITDRGMLVLDDQARWRIALAKLSGKRVCVEIEVLAASRSSKANRYYFGRVVKTLQGIWSAGRVAAKLPAYTKEETHSVIVQVCVGSEPGPIPGSVLAVSTRNMPSDVFAKLTDDARQMAWDLYQVNIPPANEPEEL
jgi:hypothetical protein